MMMLAGFSWLFIKCGRFDAIQRARLQPGAVWSVMLGKI